jgi:hypothetical protein
MVVKKLISEDHPVAAGLLAIDGGLRDGNGGL